MTNEMRLKIEKRIVRRYIKAVLADGYKVSVVNPDDSTEFDIEESSSLSDIMAVLRTGDVDTVICHKSPNAPFLYFVYGNEPGEVLSDYSVSLESVVAPVNKYAEAFA